MHKKLDDLLGQNGLQRELVRDAEQQIVELANDTLQNLSDGELSLEQDDEAAGRDDKAFALRVRRCRRPAADRGAVPVGEPEVPRRGVCRACCRPIRQRAVPGPWRR